MRFTQFIGSQSDSIEHKSIKPKDYSCPQRGQKAASIGRWDRNHHLAC